MRELPDALIGDFIDAVVEDPARAAALLSQWPELLNARWIHDETVLHFLAIEGFTEGVAFLLRRGADVDAVNEFGDTPLVDVAGLGRTDIAAMLLEHGARPDGVLITRDRPLHAAARTGNAALLRLLLNAGADPRYRTDLDETVFDAVDAAPSRNRAELLTVLADHGVVPEDPDHD